MEHLFDNYTPLPDSLLVRIPDTTPRNDTRPPALPSRPPSVYPQRAPTHQYMYRPDPRAAPYPRQMPLDQRPIHPSMRPTQPYHRPILPGFGVHKPTGAPPNPAAPRIDNPPRLPANYYNNLNASSDVSRRRKYEKRVAKQEVKKTHAPPPARDPSLMPVALLVPTTRSAPTSTQPSADFRFPSATPSLGTATSDGSQARRPSLPVSPQPVHPVTPADEKRKTLPQLLIPDADEEKAKASKVTLSEALAFLSATVSKEDIIAMLDKNCKSPYQSPEEEHEDENGLRRSKRVKRAPRIVETTDSEEEDEEESKSALTLPSAVTTAPPVTPEDGLRSRLLRKRGSIDVSK